MNTTHDVHPRAYTCDICDGLKIDYNKELPKICKWQKTQ